jgi:CheY-like chemotaxis protein
LEGYGTLTARNGQEALDLLGREPVDLVITDLRMPVMDGFELLSFMSQRYLDIPVIVMTAFGSPEVEAQIKRLGDFQYVEKPIHFRELMDKIEETLELTSKGAIRGITLHGFVQLVKMESKSCTLRVSTDYKSGYFCFENGVLINARTGELEGELAAIYMLTWEEVAIEMNNFCNIRDRNVHLRLQEILLEAFRIKDEISHSG